MKYFVISGLLLFLGLNLFIEELQFIIGPVFRESLSVVPVVSMGYLLLGIFINQSIWYKVDDKTIYGAWITIAGAAVTVAVNVVFVPVYGYVAAAWAHVACYLTMVGISYYVGQKYYPIRYETGRIVSYIVLAVILLIISGLVAGSNRWINILADMLLMGVFVAYIQFRDNFIGILLRRRNGN